MIRVSFRNEEKQLEVVLWENEFLSLDSRHLRFHLRDGNGIGFGNIDLTKYINLIYF